MSENRGIKAFTSAAAVVAKQLVKISSAGVVAVNTATATDAVIGVALIGCAIGENIPVQFLNYGGSVEMIAAGAISVGADVYAAADGEVQALPAGAGTYRYIGTALEAATADQDIIEILPADGLITTVVT